LENKRKVVYKGFSVVSKDDGYEVVEVTDSVGVLIFDIQSQNFVFVRQKRPPMKNKSCPSGVIMEVPAGRFDKKVSLKQLIIDEVWEEVGIKIDKSHIQLLNYGHPLALSPGILTERMYLAYVEIEDLRDLETKEGTTFGVASEGEETERIFVSIHDINDMGFDDLKTYALVKNFQIDN